MEWMHTQKEFQDTTYIRTYVVFLAVRKRILCENCHLQSITT